MMKYYVMGAEEKNEECINAINKYLYYNFNLVHAIKIQKFLDSTNYKRMAESIKPFYEIIDAGLVNKKIECDICNEIQYEAIYKCKCSRKNLCNDCYLKLDK